MMRGFSGFRGGREPSVPVPDSFFSILLPQIDNISELKVTLHLFSLLYRRRGLPKAVALSELETDTILLNSLKTVKGPRPAVDFLREGLEYAVARGTLLMLTLHGAEQFRPKAAVVNGSPDALLSEFMGQRIGAPPPAVLMARGGDVAAADDCWYFLNTRASREALRNLAAAQTTLAETIHRDDIVSVEVVHIHRPNIFTLYEQNIGALTPLLADELRDAELAYPAEWIDEAVRLAVESNKRSWRYIQGILRRWESEGKDNGINRGDSEETAGGSKYTSGRYGHLVQT